jgi:hypothetical protein
MHCAKLQVWPMLCARFFIIIAIVLYLLFLFTSLWDTVGQGLLSLPLPSNLIHQPPLWESGTYDAWEESLRLSSFENVLSIGLYIVNVPGTHF